MSGHVLNVKDVEKNFSGLRAISNLSFVVDEGQIKGIIGPNGAGKTTLFNAISGLIPADSGTISFLGKNTTRMKPHRIVKIGISRTFQSVQLFENMSVIENVMVGTHSRTRTGFVRAAFRLPGIRKEERQVRNKAAEMLEFVGLGKEANTMADSLPFGFRRKLEVARALATGPKLLLLDEPASGLNMTETEEFGELIKRIRDLGITILLVEHDMSLVMSISDTVLVIDHGSRIAEGLPKDIQKDERVIEVYLGSDEPFDSEVH